MQADPDYSLIQSCFPYIAKRLLKDDSPRAQKALKELLYGAGDLVDVDQIANLAEGFSTYTTTTKALTTPMNTTASTSSVANGDITVVREASISTKHKGSKTKVEEAEAVITLAKDSADVLLDPKGNLIQNLLVEEGALAASAQFKDSVKSSLIDGPQKFRDALPFGAGNVLPPLPFEGAIAPFVKKSEAEERAQLLIEKIGALVSANTARNTNGSNDEEASSTADKQQTMNALINDLEPEQAALILKELRENLPNYTGLLGQLGTKFVGKLLETASDDINTTISEVEGSTGGRSPGDELLVVAAKGVSNVAQQGAKTIRERSKA